MTDHNGGFWLAVALVVPGVILMGMFSLGHVTGRQDACDFACGDLWAWDVDRGCVCLEEVEP